LTAVAKPGSVEPPVQACFPSLIYHAPLGARGIRAINEDLAAEAEQIRDVDDAGRRWSEKRYPGGYTSYSSFDQLHRMSSTVMDLQRHIDRHVQRYAESLHWDLRDRPLVMTDCWVSIMGPMCAHASHIHPLSVISGSYYIATPSGCPGLKFEDPRLAMRMAAPPTRARAPRPLQSHIEIPARAGSLTLFESWLRHEVAPNPLDQPRISLSFNYAWA
jgi:uncharacterized protein (TIGR02466 family)